MWPMPSGQASKRSYRGWKVRSAENSSNSYKRAVHRISPGQGRRDWEECGGGKGSGIDGEGDNMARARLGCVSRALVVKTIDSTVVARIFRLIRKWAGSLIENRDAEARRC